MPDIASYCVLLAEHPWMWAAFAAVVGACLASFGGVVVDRLPHSASFRLEPRDGISLLTPSRCDSCGTRVGVIAGLPVVGWLLLRGKCSHCKSRVPWIYPAVEAGTALLSAAWALHAGPTVAGGLGLCVLWSCVVLAWIDWREAWLPDRIMAPLCVVGLLASPFSASAEDRIQGLAVASGAISLSFILMGLRRRENVFAGGDVMFCAMAGAWLGLQAATCFLFATCVLYIATHVAMKIAGRRWEPPEEKMREIMGDGAVVPMGPALAAALVICMWLAPLVLLS